MSTEAGPSLASAPDFVAYGSLTEVFRNNPDPDPTPLLTRATRAIESRCDRRLAPFTGLVESSRAEGIDNEISTGASWPLDLPAALGRSKANSFGATSLVRDLWLREYAPQYADMWTATITSLQLIRAFGDIETVGPTAVEGPQPDTGHVRLRLGTFCPPGTTIVVTYSGGYDPVPDDLVQACLLQATKATLLGAEPQTRTGMSYAELDAEIAALLDPYMRR